MDIIEISRELTTVNNELAKELIEKGKRAAELLIANKELRYQNQEKEKRAAELAIANKELIFQNIEKENRAAELIIANKELIFQNSEKGKRAAELLIANKELIFQNQEKEKRAAELIIAIKECEISEAQVVEINKELEAFSYSVSHDLRVPLRAINGYTKMLQEHSAKNLDTEGNRLLNNITQYGQKMGLLIDDLLCFSRTSRKDVVKIDIEMATIIATVWDELKAEIGDRKIKFIVNELAPATADAMAIKQVWHNLISNAIKYTKQKTEASIEIGMWPSEENNTYYIKDNGAGFDMRYADKLFGVFQRLHGDDEFEGNGVGLALVQRIITKHEGKVWAQAITNEGATFFFTLNNNMHC